MQGIGGTALAALSNTILNIDVVGIEGGPIGAGAELGAAPEAAHLNPRKALHAGAHWHDDPGAVSASHSNPPRTHASRIPRPRLVSEIEGLGAAPACAPAATAGVP